jgi:DNA-directed RNA polymerase subunit RPC12/RpoP
MDMEIEFLHRNFTEKKVLMEHIQRMASGEAPFFSATLSLVYDKLVERASAQPIASGSGHGNPTEVGNQNGAEQLARTSPAPNITAVGVYSPYPYTMNAPLAPSQQPPTPAFESRPSFDPGFVYVPDSIPLGAVWLVCLQCNGFVRMRDLYEGVRCPHCPSRGTKKGRPFMRCPSCNLVRTTCSDTCVRFACQARFA